MASHHRRGLHQRQPRARHRRGCARVQGGRGCSRPSGRRARHPHRRSRLPTGCARLRAAGGRGRGGAELPRAAHAGLLPHAYAVLVGGAGRRRGGRHHADQQPQPGRIPGREAAHERRRRGGQGVHRPRGGCVRRRTRRRARCVRNGRPHDPVPRHLEGARGRRGHPQRQPARGGGSAVRRRPHLSGAAAARSGRGSVRDQQRRGSDVRRTAPRAYSALGRPLHREGSRAGLRRRLHQRRRR